MQIITKQIPTLNFDIALFGDTHIGNHLVHFKGLEKVKRWLRAKPDSRYFVFMGDAIDSITTDDKRFDLSTSSIPIPLQQAQFAIHYFDNVREQGLAWLKGNHEDKLKRVGDLAKFIADELSIPYGTWSSKITLKHKDDIMFKMFVRHGSRKALNSNAKDYHQQLANMRANLKRQLEHHASDTLILAQGHSHKLLITPPAERLTLHDNGTEIIQDYMSVGQGNSNYIEPDRRWYISTGSFLKMYQVGVDSYAERAGYDPIELGYVIIRVKGGQVDSVERMVV